MKVENQELRKRVLAAQGDEESYSRRLVTPNGGLVRELANIQFFQV